MLPPDRSCLAAYCLAAFLLLDASLRPAGAQVAPVALTGPTDPPIVHLSVFEVVSDRDVGYQATHTISGSRLNSSLKDIAAAVVVLTPEFLADFGLNTLADIAAYSPNMQIDMLDTRADANPAFLGGSDGADTRIRVRGLQASVAMDFFEANVAVDNYNTERLELSNGPNSILFGFGSPGGLVNIMTKRAQLTRNRTALRAQAGDWDFGRFELDHNQVLLPGRLALRLNGVRQNSGGWRKWDFSDISRGAVSLRFDPWKRTTLLANYENGTMKSHVSRPLNAFDAVALWLAKGSVIKSDATWTVADRALGLNRNSGVRNIFVTNANGAAPFVLTTSNATNLRLLESTYEDTNVPAADRAGFTLVPATQIPFNYSTYGPGAMRDTNFDRWVVRIEHRLTRDVTFEFAYNREWSLQWVKAHQLNLAVFGADPNATIPNPNGTPTQVPNPNAGAPFLESRWTTDYGEKHKDAVRAALAWRLDLGRFGIHQLAGLAEHGTLRAYRYPGNEILVDDAGVPIGNAALPENVANFVTRRHYVQPGNFDTYIAGNIEQNVTVSRNGRNFHNVFINSSIAGGDIGRAMDTLMAVTQSSFFDSRAVVTAGVRWDRITFEQHGSTRLAANAPDVLAGRKIANTLLFSSEVTDRSQYEPITGTLGGVFHVNRWFSVFYNHASNNAQPALNVTILPDDRFPPPIDGLSDDGGFMLNLLDGKVSLRATAFKTSQRKTTGGTFAFLLDSGDSNLVAPTTRILDTLLANNRITPAEFLAHQVGGGGGESHLTGTSDIVNNGIEVSTWLNLSKNLTAVVNFSHTKTNRSSIMPEFEGWFERESAFWHRTPNAGSLVNASSGDTIDGEARLIQAVVAGLRDVNGFVYGERPYKANASGRYTLSEGRLRGTFLGGGVRWQSRSKLGRTILGRTASGNQIFGSTLFGPEDFKLDAFVGSRRKVSLLRRATELTVQVNATNLTDEDVVMPLRYNPKQSGYARVLLFEPRKFRCTVSLGF